PQRAAPCRQALRVIHTLDADADELAGDTERRQRGRAVGRPRRGAEVGRDADRKRPHVGRVLAADDREAVPFDPPLDGALDGLEEVVAVELRVEADEVGAQHPEQDVRLPGADADGLEVRPRNVPEERHARVGARLLHETGQQREVVVLHEHDRRLDRLHLLEQRLREALVHRAIVPPVGGAEARALVRASPVTSRAGEPKRLSSASGGGATGRPAFICLVHSAMRAIGRVTDQRTRAQVMPVTSSISTPIRTAVRRQRSHSPESRYWASRRTAAAPAARSSCCTGTTWTQVSRPATFWKPATGSLLRTASLTSGDSGPRNGRTSAVAASTPPNVS